MTPTANITRLTYPVGFEVDFDYDVLNRVTAANDNNGGAAADAYTYDGNKKRARKMMI